MKYSILLISATALFFFACGPRQEQASHIHDPEVAAALFTFEHDMSAAFFENLKTLCGKSFAGRQVYVQEGRESWADRNMVMYVTRCDEEAIHVPFHMDEDQSRTWMFLNEEGRLRFRHDHRHPDGTPEDLTLYGGYADTEQGTPFRQVFPADEYTIEIHPRSVNSYWVVELKEEMHVFSYSLYSNDALLFEAHFDLTQPLE